MLEGGECSMTRKQSWGQQAVFISSTHKSLAILPGNTEDELLIFKNILYENTLSFWSIP